MKRDGLDQTYIVKKSLQIVGRVGNSEPYIHFYKETDTG